MRKFIQRFKLLSLLLLILGGLLLGDFIGFYLTCRSYATQSLKSERPFPNTGVEKEAIVVLTGDRKRIPTAIELLRQRGTPHLIISGTGRGATLTELINSQANLAGNAQEIWRRIIVESQSTSTIENAVESEKILSKLQIKRVILVTSDYHMARSLLVFKTLAPSADYLPLPVPSEFASVFLEWQVGVLPEALWKLQLEYWKYFLFRNYYIKYLNIHA